MKMGPHQKKMILIPTSSQSASAFKSDAAASKKLTELGYELWYVRVS